MGQYYQIATSDKVNGKITNHCVQVKGTSWTGLKLMEHSYYGNHTINAVCALLFQKPMYIAWVGDYCETDKRTSRELRKTLYNACYVGDYCEVWNKVDRSNKWKYLVNHTTKQYLDLEKHFEMCHENDTFGNGEYICIHPLPLLVAIGNGLGGGDYYEGYVNYDKTGKWAWNKISIEENSPKNYKEIVCPFSETSDLAITKKLESETVWQEIKE